MVYSLNIKKKRNFLGAYQVHIHPNLLFTTYQYHSKARLAAFASRQLFLNFGHSAAPNLYNYVAALVRYGTQGRLNEWEYKLSLIHI